MIFLETDVLFELLNKKSSKGDEIFQKLEKSNESFAITSITFYEIVSFFMTSGRQVPAINLLQVYGFSKEDAQKANWNEVRVKKERKRSTFIWFTGTAIVMNKGGILCTMDNGLKVLEELG